MSTRTFEVFFTALRASVPVKNTSTEIVQCIYVIRRGVHKGEQCPHMTRPGNRLCQKCSWINAAISQANAEIALTNLVRYVPQGPITYRMKFSDTSDLSAMRNDQIMTDTNLVIPGVCSLPAHKLVLVSSSGYFQKLFLGELKLGKTQ